MNKFQTLVFLTKKRLHHQGLYKLLQQKKKAQRQLRDLIMIENALSHVNYIQGLKKRLETPHIHDLMRNIEYLHCYEGEAIYHQGEIEDRLYIIVQGRVSLEKTKISKTVRILEPGSVFGDLALTEYRERRRQTAIALEECHFATIDKDSFVSVIRCISDDIMAQVESLQKNSLFMSDWSRYDLMHLVLDCEIREYKRLDHIYKEGDKASMIYFLNLGSVENYKQLTHNNNEYDLQGNESEISRKTKIAHLSLWNQYSLFGHEDFSRIDFNHDVDFQNLNLKRITSTVVLSDRAEVWCLEIEKFIDYLRENKSHFADFLVLMTEKVLRRDTSITKFKKLNFSNSPQSLKTNLQEPKQTLMDVEPSEKSNLIKTKTPVVLPMLNLSQIASRHNSCPRTKLKISDPEADPVELMPLNFKHPINSEAIKAQHHMLRAKEIVRNKIRFKKTGQISHFFNEKDLENSRCNTLDTLRKHRRESSTSTIKPKPDPSPIRRRLYSTPNQKNVPLTLELFTTPIHSRKLISLNTTLDHDQSSMIFSQSSASKNNIGGIRFFTENNQSNDDSETSFNLSASRNSTFMGSKSPNERSFPVILNPNPHTPIVFQNGLVAKYNRTPQSVKQNYLEYIKNKKNRLY